MNTLKNILIFLVILLSINVNGQDIHFSQFYASPLNLNPALTGITDASYRIAGIYRNQWNSVTTPFVTYALSFDMKLLENKLGDNIFGGGLVVSQDKSGDGKLSNLIVMASGSFHKALGKKSKHHIGIGLQLGYIQKSIKLNELVLATQYSNGDFDETLPTMENFSNDNITAFDLQAGVLWQYKITKAISMFHGGSFFHLTQPKESFLNDDVNKLPMRINVHGGFRVKLSSKIYLTPNYIVMLQDKAQAINFGSGIEYHFTEEDIIFGIGAWYRLNDAPITSASVEYKAIRLGFSYDINTSELKPASSNKGAFEISLIYLGKFGDGDTGPVWVPCPRL